MLLSVGAFAQTTVSENIFSDSDQFDNYPHEVYCEIVSFSRGFLSRKVVVNMDFGQESNLGRADSGRTTYFPNVY